MGFEKINSIWRVPVAMALLLFLEGQCKISVLCYKIASVAPQKVTISIPRE